MPIADVASPYLFAAALMLLRLALVMVFLPALGQGTTPNRVRIALLVILVFIMDLSLGGLRVPIPESIGPFATALARECLIGAGMGLAIRLIFSAIESAGAIAGISMALSHEALVDPNSGEENGTLGWLMGVAAGLMFIAMDGHHVVIRTLHAHLEKHPPGYALYRAPGIEEIAHAAESLASDAFVLAAPAVVVGLALNATITLASRLVPSLNVFGVGLGLLTLVGLLSLGFSGDALVSYVAGGLERLPEALWGWGGGGGK